MHKRKKGGIRPIDVVIPDLDCRVQHEFHVTHARHLARHTVLVTFSFILGHPDIKGKVVWSPNIVPHTPYYRAQHLSYKYSKHTGISLVLIVDWPSEALNRYNRYMIISDQ